MRQEVRALLIVVAVVLMALTPWTEVRGAADVVKNPDTFVTLRSNDPESLDPAYAADTVSYEVIRRNVYETLIVYDGSVLSRFVPRLAMTVPSLANGLISPDGLTYTFPIRENVHFHDGSVMTPEDVRYSVLRFMLQDRGGGPSWLLLRPLLGKESTRTDAGTIAITYQEAARAVTVHGNNVIFHLAHPYAPFLSVAAVTTSVMPRAWAAAHSDWDGMPGTWRKYNNPQLRDRYAFDHMNGTGPFKFEQWDRQGMQVILVRHDHYWRSAARLARVVIRTVEEFVTRRLALQRGDADVIDVQRPDKRKVEGLAGVTIHDDLPVLLLQAFHFNLKIDPTGNPDIGSGKLDGIGIPPDFFSDVHVRRAFAYAFDYATFIRDAYNGKAVQPNGPIIQGILGYDPTLPGYTFNREKAIAEIKEAWGGMAWSTGFKFTVTYNNGNVYRQIATRMVKDEVEAMNPKFKIDIRTLQWSSYLQLIDARKGTLYPIGSVLDYPDPDELAREHLGSTGYWPKTNGYTNPEADRLIQEGALESDQGKRREIYRRLTKIAYDDVPEIDYAQPLDFEAMRSWVHGWYYSAILVAALDYYPLYKE